jgi:hypothetical protein
VDVLLLMAASENDIPKVEELLGAGANINITDNAGKSPLQLATKPEVIEMIEVGRCVRRRGCAQQHGVTAGARRLLLTPARARACAPAPRAPQAAAKKGVSV